MKGCQHLGCASQNAYKHIGFLMILSAFSRKVVQNEQETIGFIRVRILDFAVCGIASFPQEYEGLSTSRICITECL